MTSPQTPIDSPFGPASTATDVMAHVDLRDQFAIVTGGYSGLGLVAARQLARAGAKVIVAAKDVGRANQAFADDRDIEVLDIDLASPSSVGGFCERILARGHSISLVLNNAGIMATPFQRDLDGLEMQFAVNHLGHYRMTCGLWSALTTAGHARVITVSSRAHHLSAVDFDDINFRYRPYDKWLAYGQSKTANALFAVELDRRGRGYGVRAYSVHPGQILTNLARHLAAEEVARFGAYDSEGNARIDPSNGLKNVEQGAATVLWSATSPLLDERGGVYCEDCNIAALLDASTSRRGVASWATDADNAKRLWELSESQTGLSAD